MDVLHKAATWTDRNRGTFVGLLLACLACCWLFACAPRTTSTIDPARKVTLEELQTEVIVQEGKFVESLAEIEKQQKVYNAQVETYFAQVDAAKVDLQRQADLRAKVVEVVGGLATSAVSGQIPPATSVVGGIVSIMAMCMAGGTIYDNRRKDRIIAEKSEKTAKT